MDIVETEGPDPSPYGDKVERIYRVLLSRNLKHPTWYRIAKEADVGYSWAHRVMKDLERDGMIKGRELKDPRALFARWAARKDRRVYREYHIQDPASVLKGAGVDYALTGYFAENLIGHYVFPRYHEFYVHRRDAPGWHERLSGKGYVGKGNVQVLLADEHVFYEATVVDGWPVVSIQQLIVDLYRTGAECGEAADLLVGRAYG
jgi:hypothetical protein